MLQLAEMLCGPLPVYHPVALLLNIYSGNWRRACAAVQHLVEYLNSNPHVSCDEGRTHNHIIPQIPLSMLFDEQSSTELGDKVLQWGQDVTSGSSAEVSQTNSILSFGYNSEANLSTSIYNSTSIKSEISGFSETLEKYHGISGTTSMERTQILAIIDILDEITDSRRHSVYESFDAPGRRFWVSVRFQQLHYRRRFGRLATMEELVVDSELMGWAHHSDCQENLCSSTLSDEPTWQEMRNLGVGFWFTDSMHLRKRMEKLARSQYLKNKDPKDCALLYIALNRLQVLAGLFKISRDEKDKPLAGFLSRSFQEEKNKAAALKNAYVLMGRHQHELASAFFLLGGDPSSAITVCAKNLGDEQLALVICRLIEGCGGPLEGHLISKFLLPSALERGDHWLASLLEWLNGNYSKSFLRLLGIKLDPLIEQVVSWNVASFSDPKVGQYGVMLATKTSMKNSIGEAKASMLTRWATAVSSIALNRCGLPLEALECVPCSVGTFEGKDQGSILDDGTDGFLHEILKADNSNWLSGEVALYLESNLQLSLASQYISNLIKEHPSWPYLMLTSSRVFDTEDRTCHCRPSVENFQLKLKAGLTTFERKYSLSPALLMNMILVFSYNNGLLFHGYHVLHGCISQEHSHYTSATFGSVLHPPLPQLFLNAVEECEHFVARYIVACSIIPGSYPSSQLHALSLYTEGLICAVKSLRDVLKIYCPGILSEDLSMKASMVIELTEYYVFLVSTWIQRNIRGLTLMISPMLSKREGEHAPEVDLKNLKSACHKTRSIIYGSLGGLLWVSLLLVATAYQMKNVPI
ncbi:hypothetical protein Scep_005996 [Stephania cephalantha]|uniref:RAVE complex protein Rav1 C-terminal domain-containing protein n=1 Tax=Stephania cephalantha TaxID=152367 RepID=A0AAP0K8R4_9MAGN